MGVSILFVALLAGSSSGLRTQQESKITPSELSLNPLAKAKSGPAHFIPAIGTVCFEGPDEMSITAAVSSVRAGPLANFSAHSGVALNKSCPEAGFTKLISENDTCFQGRSMYTKEELDVTIAMTALRAQNLEHINTFAKQRGLSLEFAQAWSVCNGGCSDGTQTGFRWWGADRTYNKSECETTMHSIAPTLRKARTVGSFVADSGLMCWEGPIDYMKTILMDTQRTPGPSDMFGKAVVQKKTCSELGFDEVRDPRDECWPEASKLARRGMQGGMDMLRFVMGNFSYWKTMTQSDRARGFPNGTSVDLASCNCQKGGANRDRGMLYTIHRDGLYANANGGYIPRYSDEFCQDLLNKYRN